MSAPLIYRWDGDAMVPHARFRRLADKDFVVGQDYTLVEHQGRSAVSHNHYFAAITEAWKNLPEVWAERFPTVEHLRKYALIKAGFADERSIVCASKAEAQRMAGFVRPFDDYAIVLVNGATVKVFTAKSQSARAMDKAEFQDSKQKVLDIVSDMIGVEPAALSSNAGMAA